MSTKAKPESTKPSVSPLLKQSKKKAKESTAFVAKTMKDKNVIITRSVHRFVYGAVSLGTPFHEHLPPECRLQEPLAGNKNYNWVYLPVVLACDDFYTECQLFAGLNIMRVLPGLRVDAVTFVDAALVVLAMARSNAVVEKLLTGIFSTADGGLAASAFDRETQAIKTRADTVKKRAAVTAVLLNLSCGRIIDNPAPLFPAPVLINFHPQHRLVECTHARLRNELVGIAALVGVQHHTRKDGAMVLAVVGKFMSIAPFGMPFFANRFRRLHSLGENKAALDRALASVEQIAPLANANDTTVEPHHPLHVAYFEVLWQRTSHATVMENLLFFDESRFDDSFMDGADDNAGLHLPVPDMSARPQSEPKKITD